MSVHDAMPGDVYRDDLGRLWLVQSYCAEPTVMMERLAPGSEMVPADNKRHGGIYGLMWQGFVKFSPAKPTGDAS